jgi:serine protease Do
MEVIIMGENDFVQKFNYSKNSNRKQIATTVVASFVSAVVGGACALGVYVGLNKEPAKAIETSKTNTSTVVETSNPNLSQVSLTNYSDTAIYAAQKALPSMVSISVEYDVNYMGMKKAVAGSGSGVILSEDGYILTNNHVISSADSSSFYQVSDAKSIKVKIYGDDTEYSAEIIGTDSQTDLAVLKIDKTGLTPAELGDSSSVQIGEFVLAIGNPYNLDYSVTAGIISALNREMTVENTTYNVIQADCAINSGNSGGALVNGKGEVIGITTLKLAGDGIEGVSFAIPVNETVPIYKELIEKGKISRPFVGISGIDLDEATAIRNGLTKGIYVDSVVSGSGAEDAGIMAGDVIVSFDGKDVSTMDELNAIKNTKNIGDKIEIKLYRKSELKTFTITLKEAE